MRLRDQLRRAERQANSPVNGARPLVSKRVTRRAIRGSELSISAPPPQASSNTAYEFVSWSDGGPQAHTSQVQYGPTTAYGSTTPLDRTLVTSHSVTISGLARKAQYRFQVLSRDAVRRLSSATGSFVTK